MGIDLLFSVSV